MQDIEIIDAHHHFWDLDRNPHPWLQEEAPISFRYGDYSAIRRNYLIEDYRANTKNWRVTKTIHMEAEWDPKDPVGETKWLHAYHDQTGFPNAVVGQVWFDRTDAADVLAGHAAFPLVRSVRQKPKAALSPDQMVPGAQGSLADPAFREGYRLLEKHGLHYDLQTPWWHLGEAADLARDFPDTLIVLNHAGLPSDRSEGGLARWREAIERFADQPNTVVKLSGIGVPGEAWTEALQGDILRTLIDAFGAERCMAASNFPVDSLCATFDEIFGTLDAVTRPMGEAARDAIFRGTAQRVYRPV